LPGAVTISSTLVANTVGAPSTSPASATVCIVDSFAAAKTSAGPPLTICWARSDDAPKLMTTSTPGLPASNRRSSSPKASVRDAAAKTMSVRGWAAAG
jgi:hypothetical protein